MVETLKLLSTPMVFILFFLICGLILVKDKRGKPRMKRAGFYITSLAVLILYLLSINPVSNLLTYSLESGYEPPSRQALSKLDLVVILGGGFIPSGGFRQYPEASGTTYSRLFNGVEIFNQSGAKKLVLSGTCPSAGNESDAEIMTKLAARLGVPNEKIITESKSRNTMEHVVELMKLFPPDKKTQIGIVTSAIHMFRAERAFRKKFAKENITPIPVNYTSYPPDFAFSVKSFIPYAENFLQSTMAIHELIGMVWYFLKGAV